MNRTPAARRGAGHVPESRAGARAGARTPGAYLLTVRLRRGVVWPGAGGGRTLHAGWYVYAGSALGGLEGRLARHLRTRDIRHWHVDRLLAAGTVEDIQAVPGRDPVAECRLAAAARAWPGAVAIPGFGAGDCRCGSHLAWFARRPGGSCRAGGVLEALPALCERLSRDYADHTAEARDPFRTLAACLLSLRTRDPVTAAAAGRLFGRWPDAWALAGADPDEVAHCIRPVGMFRRKARGLKAVARHLVEHCGGRVPADLEGLLALPGVGPKTANLVLSFAHGQPAVCVDTHVHRIANRWGLVRTASPEQTERELRALVPHQYWRPLNPWLVQHGQRVCLPRRPRCSSCGLAFGCGYAALRAEREVLRRVPGAPAHPALGDELPAG